MRRRPRLPERRLQRPDCRTGRNARVALSLHTAGDGGTYDILMPFTLRIPNRRPLHSGLKFQQSISLRRRQPVGADLKMRDRGANVETSDDKNSMIKIQW